MATADEQPGLIQRLLPQGLLGLASMVFFMGLASAFTGAVLYAYYESRLEKIERQVDAFVGGFTDEVDGARATVQAEGDRAVEQVQQQLDELQQFTAGGATLTGLLERTQPSVWFVQTLDESGGPSVGSAFVVFSDPQTTFLLTSFETIRAATQEPAPDVVLQQGDQQLQATVFTWDQPHDLALLTIAIGDQPALPFVSDAGSVAIGDRVFSVGGLGAQGGSIAQGTVIGIAGNALQHDVPIGAAFRGAPLLDSDGEVVGVSSRAYQPLGFDPLAVFFAPPIRTACEVVIQCPDGVTPAGPAG